MIVKLLVVQGRPPGKQLYFGPGEYYLGRGPECQVRFNTDWISRQHCLLRVEAGQALLRDLSRNGTLVNGNLVANDQKLANGDQVQIGPVVFQVELVEASSVIPAPGSSAFFRDGSSSDPGPPEMGMESTAHQLPKAETEPPS